MKRYLLASVLAFSAVGCVEPEQEILISFARPLETDETTGACTPSEDFQTGGGSLDISGSGSYLLGFDLTSKLERVSETVGGREVANASRNDITITEEVLSYVSTPNLSLEDETVSTRFLLTSGENDEAYNISDLIGPKAEVVLREKVLPGSPVELKVTLKYQGTIASGGAAESNEITFPISVFSTGFTACTAPAVLIRNGPCGRSGGQDGTSPTCVAPVPETGT